MDDVGQSALEGAIAILREILENPNASPNMTIDELSMDSLDLLEWCYALEIDLGAAPSDFSSIPEGIMNITVGELYSGYLRPLQPNS